MIRSVVGEGKESPQALDKFLATEGWQTLMAIALETCEQLTPGTKLLVLMSIQRLGHRDRLLEISGIHLEVSHLIRSIFLKIPSPVVLIGHVHTVHL